MKFVILLLLSFLAVNSMKLRDCNLNRVPEVFDLDPSRLEGVWYPVMMSISNKNYDCFKVNFNMLTTNSTFLIEMLNQTDGSYLSLETSVSPQRNDTFISTGDSSDVLRWYNIFDTDYDTYMVAVYCVQSQGSDAYYAHILSRTSSLPEDLLLKIKEHLNRFFYFEFVNIKQGDQCLSVTWA
jgi:hypothetical protein